MSSYPPVRTISSIPVPDAIALTYLTAYLDLTPSNPYLLPNAKLEPSGPTTGASNSSITISNLQRLQAGLRGEWLPPVFDLGEDSGVVEGLGAESGQSESNGAEWQNLDDYQLEQEEIEGEVAPTPTVVIDGEKYLVEDAEEAAEVALKPSAKSLKRKHDGTAGESEQVAKKPKDKEARKAEKKERQKAEQREKIKARTAAKAAGYE